MQLNLTLKALVYNTTQAYYNCSLAYGECTFRTSFSDGYTVVLTTPGTKQVSPISTELSPQLPLHLKQNIKYFSNIAVWTTNAYYIFQGIYYDDWYVELSYGPRWITYTIGLGTILIYSSQIKVA